MWSVPSMITLRGLAGWYEVKVDLGEITKQNKTREERWQVLARSAPASGAWTRGSEKAA